MADKKEKDEKPISFTAFGNEPHVISEESMEEAKKWRDNMVKKGLIADPKKWKPIPTRAEDKK